MKNLIQLLKKYAGTNIIAPIPVGVQVLSNSIQNYDCHCSSDDCTDCYDCHCSTDDCTDCYDCHCSTDDCA